MTSKSKYLSVLEDYATATDNGFNIDTVGAWCFDNRETILRALRIAEKLQQEPSEAMVLAALDRPNGDDLYSGVFKAMAAELIREEDE